MARALSMARTGSCLLPEEARAEARVALLGRRPWRAEIEICAFDGQISSNPRLVDAGQPARMIFPVRAHPAHPSPQAVLGDRVIAPSHLQVRRAFLSVLELVVISTACSYADNLKSKAKAPFADAALVGQKTWKNLFGKPTKSGRRAFGRPSNTEGRWLRTFATHWPCHNAW